MKKKLISVLLVLIVAISLAACGGQKEDTEQVADTNTDSSGSVRMRVFSNLTDRKSGQGLIEQTLFDNYMEENPNVKIEVVALDDEAYKTKFKAYASSNEMPDIVNSWGQPSFLNEVIDAGIFEELNPDDYKDYGFINGSLDQFSKEGKLYGLPRNTDVMGFYYNKAIFDANGWEVPKTYDELLGLASKSKDVGIAAVSMDGADKWPLAIYMQDLIIKEYGEEASAKIYGSIANGGFSAPEYVKAAELLQKAVDEGLFQNGFETADYGTAKNLFANGQAAMFYMGSWEMSMATSEDVVPEVRDNIGVFPMPVVEGGKGKVTDIPAWNGGGYSISASSEVKEEAVKLLNYMFKPENWSKLAWENGVCMSAQDYSAFLTGKETGPQKEFTSIVTSATSVGGVTMNDRGTAEYKTLCEDLTQQLAIKAITPEEYLKSLGEAATK